MLDSKNALIQREEVRRSIPKVLLTKRDLELLRFVLEMKFADIESLHQKFFTELQSGQKSTSLWYARDRVGLLKKHGYLLPKRISFYGSVYFQATHRAYRTLSGINSENEIVRPLSNIDIRTFEHDLWVLKLRLSLEENESANRWIADRCLRSLPDFNLGLASGFIPDGLYLNPDGEFIAIEVERARKSLTAYRKKVERFVELIRRPRNCRFRIAKVRFFTHKPINSERLFRETKIYGNLFSVEPLSNFIDIGVES